MLFFFFVGRTDKTQKKSEPNYQTKNKNENEAPNRKKETEVNKSNACVSALFFFFAFRRREMCMRRIAIQISMNLTVWLLFLLYLPYSFRRIKLKLLLLWWPKWMSHCIVSITRSTCNNATDWKANPNTDTIFTKIYGSFVIDVSSQEHDSSGPPLGRSNPWPIHIFYLNISLCPRTSAPETGCNSIGYHVHIAAQFLYNSNWQSQPWPIKICLRINIIINRQRFCIFVCGKGASFEWAPSSPSNQLLYQKNAQYRHEEVEKIIVQFIPANALGNESATLATFWMAFISLFPVSLLFAADNSIKYMFLNTKLLVTNYAYTIRRTPIFN